MCMYICTYADEYHTYLHPLVVRPMQDHIVFVFSC